MNILGARTVFAAGLGLLAACSGGGSESGSASLGGSNAGVTVAITESPSTEIESFTVRITALRIQKAGGAALNVISAPVEVDLTRLSDASQVINTLVVPAGAYTSATITIDFADATCFLVGHSMPAQILGIDGTPLTGTVTLPMQFDSSPLNAVAGHHRLLELDFDVAQSIVADRDANTVSIEPALELRTEPIDRDLDTLATLVRIDAAHMTFVARVQAPSHPALGDLEFAVSDSTVFQIDGVTLQGAAGIALLGSKVPGVWLEAHGRLDPDHPRIRAAFVEVGVGTWNGGTDIVEGHIVDRLGGAGSSALLTVLGDSSNAAHTVFQFDRTFLVNTNFGGTKVVRQGSAADLDVDDLEVGQRVRIFAIVNGGAVNATPSTSVIREEPTRVRGEAAAAAVNGVLTIGLSHVDLVPMGTFAWSHGAGTIPPDPTSFRLDVGTLGNGLGIVHGTEVVASGFFPPVDFTGPDFAALALSKSDLAPSTLVVRNRPGGFDTRLETLPAEIQIMITGTAGPGEVAKVFHDFTSIDLPRIPTPRIQPFASGGHYVLRDKSLNTWTSFASFSDFSQSLETALGEGAQLRQLSFVGRYAPTTNLMSSGLAHAVVQ